MQLNIYCDELLLDSEGEVGIRVYGRANRNMVYARMSQSQNLSNESKTFPGMITWGKNKTYIFKKNFSQYHFVFSPLQTTLGVNPNPEVIFKLRRNTAASLLSI